MQKPANEVENVVTVGMNPKENSLGKAKTQQGWLPVTGSCVRRSPANVRYTEPIDVLKSSIGQSSAAFWQEMPETKPIVAMNTQRRFDEQDNEPSLTHNPKRLRHDPTFHGGARPAVL